MGNRQQGSCWYMKEEKMKEAFRRINYFKGFFVQAEDLQNAERYHIEKRRLHNRCLHTPGVVAGCMGGLAVTATKDGTTLTVAPGCAIDGRGRELYLPVASDLPLDPKDYNPPCTVYVIVAYGEEEDDLRPDKENPEFEGHAFIVEHPKCEVVMAEPDNNKVIELARISLSADEARIRSAEDTHHPNDNEIDCRYVQMAAAIQGPQRLKALRQNVMSGEIDVNPTETGKEAKDLPRAFIEKVNVQNTAPAYLVSVCPLEKGHITWQIEAFSTQRDVVEYRLTFRNDGEETVKVRWQAYRFDL
jgi:hypothetical protein